VGIASETSFCELRRADVTRNKPIRKEFVPRVMCS
jgi:hypothetical protein